MDALKWWAADLSSFRIEVLEPAMTRIIENVEKFSNDL
jgi:hypothetical protein